MSKANRYSPEVREQAVRIILEQEKGFASRWSALCSISSKIGCTPEPLRSWLKRVEIDAGRRLGVANSEQERIKALEKENEELCKANDILKTASAFFTQAALDRRLQ